MVKETQQPTINFLDSLMRQNLRPNFHPPCNLNSIQDVHDVPSTSIDNNIVRSDRVTQTFKIHKHPQREKKFMIKSDWSTDSEDGKDNQARRPMNGDIISDQDTDAKRRQKKRTETPLRLPNTMPKVLTLPRGRGYLLANWTSVASQKGNPPLGPQMTDYRHDM